ncbi:MAG: PD-(D/E)XK nuclease-like domain-containing protein [Actinomycetota bacterium]|nr:PD-(D/E)XK nuclease-like domain-containing protein [Actinomycetota bacterium]MEE3040110.1 PD-(D/E)XK nuclease-like domain-containing protein [Candidatus Latescibacterota bacterium]
MIDQVKVYEQGVGFEPEKLPLVLPDLSDTAYHANKHVLTSSRARKLITHSPAHVRASLDNPTETAAMVFGKVVHALLLEDDVFARRFQVREKCDRRTKAGKALWESYNDTLGNRTPVPQDVYDDAMRAVGSAAKLFGECGVSEEVSMFEHSFYAEVGGVACAARPDILTDNGDGTYTMVDVKTSADLEAWSFLRSCQRYGYFTQFLHYCQVLAACGYIVNRVRILAVENSEPFTARVFAVPMTRIEQEAASLAVARDTWKHCISTGEWDGWPAEVFDLEDIL